MKKYLFLLVCCLWSFFSFAQDGTSPLNVNDDAPLFEALDQNGNEVSLQGLTAKGKVVLIFYRGEWCPYCNKQLSMLEDSLQFITDRGATVVAVAPETKENVAKTIAKTKASFPVISDKGLKIMQAYNVAFEVDKATVQKYKGYGIDFAKANGGNGAVLPVPAVYIIDKDNKIIYSYFDTDYKKRASVAEIIEHL